MNKLKAIPGVKDVNTVVTNDDTSTHQVDIIADADSGSDIRAAVFYVLSRGGWPMLEFRSKDPSLEEIFLSITSA